MKSVVAEQVASIVIQEMENVRHLLSRSFAIDTKTGRRTRNLTNLDAPQSVKMV
jgi:hypothetical protein